MIRAFACGPVKNRGSLFTRRRQREGLTVVDFEGLTCTKLSITLELEVMDPSGGSNGSSMEGSLHIGLFLGIYVGTQSHDTGQ